MQIKWQRGRHGTKISALVSFAQNQKDLTLESAETPQAVNQGHSYLPTNILQITNTPWSGI